MEDTGLLQDKIAGFSITIFFQPLTPFFFFFH
jgi:hypothetical protein